ncbi:MAG: calcium-binding protein [Methyloceanibacter sp.]|uniref:calcium-binding protein n=1 Tax=Methyloceanibacter sp. TaxID=1965321 RepID=UPI003D6D0185
MVDIPANSTTTAMFEGALGTSSVPAFATFSDQLEVSGDRDWIKIELEAGVIYEFHMHFQNSVVPASGGDSMLRIYNSNGVIVASNNDRADGDQNSYVSFIAPTTGTYFVEASEFGDDRVGDYSILFMESDGLTNHILDGTDNTYTGTPDQRILGGRGDDTITLGEANDALGEQGNDTITGNDLDNRISGGLGDDIIQGGGGKDYLFGDAGTDTIVGGSSADYLWGGSGDDTLFGNTESDVLYGGTGNDKLFGGDGFDHFIGGPGVDEMYGGNDGDFFRLKGNESIDDTFRGGAGIDCMQLDGGAPVTLRNFDAQISEVEAWDGNGLGLFGTSGANTFNFAAIDEVKLLPFIDGMGGNDKITGSDFVDDLRGGSGNDTLKGGDGDDVLTGGAGRDVLTGGADRDFFDFNKISESKVGSQRDKIMDFKRGQDHIDLKNIDAKTGVGGNNKFKFIGKDDFGGTKGELRYEDNGSKVIVQGDVNGDGKADFEIYVKAGALSAGDFIL